MTRAGVRTGAAGATTTAARGNAPPRMLLGPPLGLPHLRHRPRAFLSNVALISLSSSGIWLLGCGGVEASPVLSTFAQLDYGVIETAVAQAGALGPVVFVLAYGMAALLLVPASILTISAGFLFGPALGTALVSAGSTFGAALSFLVARYFARSFVEDKIKTSNARILVAVDKAIESQGSKVVFLMRLSPLFPYSLINYSLGLTRIPFAEYIVASWAGMLPGTVAYTGIGAAGKAAMDVASSTVDSTNPLVVVLYAVGAIATVLVTTIIGKTASAYLQEDED
jgi:uncharacterized membrane protein YdjX (TVP38/TMEM64 family)